LTVSASDIFGSHLVPYALNVSRCVPHREWDL